MYDNNINSTTGKNNFEEARDEVLKGYKTLLKNNHIEEMIDNATNVKELNNIQGLVSEINEMLSLIDIKNFGYETNIKLKIFNHLIEEAQFKNKKEYEGWIDSLKKMD